MDDSRIKELTKRHRGDPVHMGHSIHHPEPIEQRSSPQVTSALVIMGRGHEVGVFGYGNVAHPQIPPKRLAHRRSVSNPTPATQILEAISEESSQHSKPSAPAACQHVVPCGMYSNASGHTSNRSTHVPVMAVYADPCTLPRCPTPVPLQRSTPQMPVSAAQPTLQRSTTTRQMSASAISHQIPLQRTVSCH